MLRSISLIGETLVEQNALPESEWQRATALAEKSDQSIRIVLDRLGLVAQETWASAAASAMGLKLVSLDSYSDAPIVHARVTTEFLETYKIAILAENDSRVAIAMADPTNGYAIEAIGLALGKKILPCVAVERDIEARLRAAVAEKEDEISVSAIDHSDDFEKLKSLASIAPVIKYVDELIGNAVRSGASDIHIEPFEKHTIVRIRIDGVLENVEPPNLGSFAAVVSRIKILAGLDIAERRLPQDGRARMKLDGHDVDIRVATSPCIHGESVVLRILLASQTRLNLPDLGFDGSACQALERLLSANEGMIVVTGPTGSGKTTSLYSVLDILNDGKRKILTVEDPVEYQVDGVVQIPVQENIGRTFATSLRSILRQDPDVVMVGEMRDSETAQIASQAALTGHLVLSTLHTNDAPSAVVRLRDMGIEPYLIASTIRAAIAQRLTRKLCNSCKTPINADFLQGTAIEEFIPVDAVFYKANGCDDCNGKGYKGRIAVYEIMTITDEISRLISAGADSNSLRSAAISAGMIPLMLDAICKAGRGLISLDDALIFSDEA